MLGNILRLGFGKTLRGTSQDRAESLPRQDFAPIERRVRTTLPEKRSTVSEPYDLTSGRLHLILGGGTSSGVAVNENTALNVSAFIACVRLISDMVAKLPVELLQRTSAGPKIIKNHPAAWLLATAPGEMHTPFELKKMVMNGKSVGGNGYARVFRDSYFEPREIQWIKPCDVKPEIRRKPSGEMFPVYRVEGVKDLLTRSDIIHVKNESIDGLCGLSTVSLLRESLGTALSQTAAAGKLMRNGARFPGILISETIHKKETIDAAREEWDRNTTEGNLGKTPILNGSFKFQQTNGMSMVDAQYLETRRFELQEICRVFGIQPFLVGDSSASTTWGTGIQEMTLGFLNFCLDPHLKAFEEAIDCTLLTTEERRAGYYFKFDRDELASVSRQDTAAYFQTMRTIGVYSPNDVRAKLDEPLISKEDGGDTYGNPNTSAPGKAPAAEPDAEPEPEPTA